MNVIWWQLIERFGLIYQTRKMSSYKMIDKILHTRHLTPLGQSVLPLLRLDCWTHTQVEII